MLFAIFLLLIGFVVLGVGAELIVRGSISIALKLGISPLVIGLTVVAFGTSAPELAVSIQSALEGRSAIALGNVIGSNIANIGLILGLMALISPITIDVELVKKQIPMMIGFTAVLWFMLLDSILGKFEGALLLGCLAGFLLHSYRTARKDEASLELMETHPAIVSSERPVWYYLLILVAGLGMLLYGGGIFVDGAVNLAQILGVSEAVIGITIVAVGTSIPELATSLVAAFRKEPGLAVGNIVGSNIFNILGILGITALLQQLVNSAFGSIDFGIMLIYAVVVLPFAWTNLLISRREGAALLGGYAAFMTYVLVS